MSNNTNKQENLAYRAGEGNLTLDDVKRASDKVVVEHKDDYGYNVLFRAAEKSNVELVEAILDKGADINELVGPFNYTPLVIAVFHKKWDVARLLLSRGASAVSINSFDGRNALHDAAENNAPDDIIQALLVAEADGKIKDKEGNTPADIARQKGNHAMASLIEQFYYPPIKSANILV
jgi:ankyrin repeat protein